MKKKLSLVLTLSCLCITLALSNSSLAVFEEELLAEKRDTVRVTTSVYQGVMTVENKALSVQRRQETAKQDLLGSMKDLIQYARAQTGLNEEGTAWIPDFRRGRTALYVKQKENLEQAARQYTDDERTQTVLSTVLGKVQDVLDFWERNSNIIPVVSENAKPIFGRVSPDERPFYAQIAQTLRDGIEAAGMLVEDSVLLPIGHRDDVSDDGRVAFFSDQVIHDIFYMSRSQVIANTDQAVAVHELHIRIGGRGSR